MLATEAGCWKVVVSSGFDETTAAIVFEVAGASEATGDLAAAGASEANGGGCFEAAVTRPNTVRKAFWLW